MTQHNSIFIWSHTDKWPGIIIAWFEEFVSSEMLDRAKEDPQQYFYEEKCHVSQQSITAIDSDVDSSVRAKLSRKFREAYSRIRLFHACRPSDVGIYLRNGLIPLAAETANEIARDLFLTGAFPLVTETMLVEAITELSVEHRGGRLYLSLDDVALINYGGHYLIYGSEYLSALAATLSRRTGENCFSVLKNIGIPTIFVCDVPLSYLTESDTQSLLQELISQVTLKPEIKKGQVYCLDYTFEFFTPLPATVITSHYHPAEIPDRINNSGLIVSSQVSCPFCIISDNTHSC